MNMFKHIAACLPLAAFLSWPASAVVFWGNPLPVVDGSDCVTSTVAVLSEVLYETCDGSFGSLHIDEPSVDLLAGAEIDLPGSNACSIHVEFDDELLVAGTNSRGAFTIEVSSVDVVLTFDQLEALTYTVVSGTRTDALLIDAYECFGCGHAVPLADV